MWLLICSFCLVGFILIIAVLFIWIAIECAFSTSAPGAKHNVFDAKTSWQMIETPKNTTNQGGLTCESHAGSIDQHRISLSPCCSVPPSLCLTKAHPAPLHSSLSDCDCPVSLPIQSRPWCSWQYHWGLISWYVATIWFLLQYKDICL